MEDQKEASAQTAAPKGAGIHTQTHRIEYEDLRRDEQEPCYSYARELVHLLNQVLLSVVDGFTIRHHDQIKVVEPGKIGAPVSPLHFRENQVPAYWAVHWLPVRLWESFRKNRAVCSGIYFFTPQARAHSPEHL
ncbi:MAG: hypothetical protein R3B47_18125 [Bacteroidia bacterium]